MTKAKANIISKLILIRLLILKLQACYADFAVFGGFTFVPACVDRGSWKAFILGAKRFGARMPRLTLYEYYSYDWLVQRS